MVSHLVYHIATLAFIFLSHDHQVILGSALWVPLSPVLCLPTLSLTMV